MSGGSMNYFHREVRSVGGGMLVDGRPLREALREHMFLLADALHAVEWVDSGDWSHDDGREDRAIRAVLGPEWGKRLAAAKMREALELLEDGSE